MPCSRWNNIGLVSQVSLNYLRNVSLFWSISNGRDSWWTGSGVSRPFPRQLKGTFISLPDKGLLRRFRTDPSDPQHPPTETSLRESIARSERSNSASGPSKSPLVFLTNKLINRPILVIWFHGWIYCWKHVFRSCWFIWSSEIVSIYCTGTPEPWGSRRAGSTGIRDRWRIDVWNGLVALLVIVMAALGAMHACKR